jgi:hypothetical protein
MKDISIDFMGKKLSFWKSGFHKGDAYKCGKTINLIEKINNYKIKNFKGQFHMGPFSLFFIAFKGSTKGI